MTGTSHAKDFRPPWKPFRYDPEHDMRESLPEEMAHMADGFSIPVGPCMSITAVFLDGGNPCELWDVEINIGIGHAFTSDSVRVHVDTDAARAVLSESLRLIHAYAYDLTAALDQASVLLDETKPVPKEPAQMTGAPLTWHDPKRQVPVAPDLVYVAWTDAAGKKHDGDRLASYRDGKWYWAFGTDIAVADAVTIDYWMPCRKRPD